MNERDREILALFEAGNPRGLARAISRAEAGGGAELMHVLFPRSGRAITIGVTGPPGVGKSTLSSALVKIARTAGKTVGVVSVDPSSPFSHGAILGDRIRLTEHFTDRDVFIRSMASRGHLGGLAGATSDAVDVLDAAGFDVVVIETVGVGQDEVDIVKAAETTVVVLPPGLGDDIQAIKAGILEIADVFVVNKADHPMALQLKREIRGMMEMLTFAGWVPRLVSTKAHEGGGVDELWSAILAHEAYLCASGDLAERRRAAFAHRVRALVLGALEGRVDRRIEELISVGGTSAEDPYRVAAALLAPLEAVLPPADDDHFARTPKPRASVKGL